MKSIVFAIVAGLGISTLSWGSPYHEPPAARGATDAQTSVSVPDEAQRTVQIRPDTRWVNVRRLETVRFVVGDGQSETAFVRRMDGHAPSFPLKNIAPNGLPGVDQVKVYVMPDRISHH